MRDDRLALTLRGAAIVDVVSGSVRHAHDVVVAGDRITRIVPTGARGPADADSARVIDARGGYLIPGLIDMHSHAMDAAEPTVDRTLMLTYGITGFRQMSGSRRMLAQRAHEPDERAMARPLAMPGEVLTPANAGTPALAAAEVRAQAAAGADFIKVGLLAPPAFEAAQRAARETGLPFVGHVSPAVDVRVASRRGMRSIEHLGPETAVLAACSREEASLRAAARPAPSPALPAWGRSLLAPVMRAFIAMAVVNPTRFIRERGVDALQRAVDTFDPERARGLAREFADAGTWHCPTLVRQDTSYGCDRPAHARNPALRYVSAGRRRSWERTAARARRRPAPERALFQTVLALHAELVRIFDEEGVGLLAGSDSSGAVWDIPGDGLHQEFALLSSAGLSAQRVLQTATSDAARFLDLADEVGRVEVGMRADLVLLDADPLTDASSLGAIRAVIVGGHHLGADRLDLMRAGLEGRV